MHQEKDSGELPDSGWCYVRGTRLMKGLLTIFCHLVGFIGDGLQIRNCSGRRITV